MKVYAVVASVPYEYTRIVQMHASEESALRLVEYARRNYESCGELYEVEEYEVKGDFE